MAIERGPPRRERRHRSHERASRDARRRDAGPLAVLIITVVLVVVELRARGPLLVIAFPQAHGLKTGDAIRYRGMDVGEVRELGLHADGVQAQIRLRPDAAALARRGSRFWIVRPQLGIEGASGLDTLIGARYVAVRPGRGPAQFHFDGLAEAPVRTPDLRDGLELVLQARQSGGLQARAPVFFRQVEVGRVLSVALASDASAVEVRVVIRSRFAELVRRNSRFWRIGGVEVDAGIFSGLELRVDSLTALLRGGVIFATPDAPGPVVATGARFDLHAAPDDEWLEWRPALPLVEQLLPADAVRPQLLRAATAWTEGSWFSRDRRRSCWVLPLRDGLLGPAAVLQPPDASERRRFEVAGSKRDYDQQAVQQFGALLRIGSPVQAQRYPADRLRSPTAPEDLVLLADPEHEPRFLAAARIREVDDGLWLLDEELVFPAGWNGAAVLAVADGLLIGQLLLRDDAAYIIPLPHALTATNVGGDGD